MEIIKDWKLIRKHVSESFRSSMHVSIAGIDANGLPINTPIGTLFLNSNQTGFYFEKFTSNLSRSSNQSNNICVLAVNSNRYFWIKSLFQGRFKKHPALKIYGELGKKRKATEKEMHALERRMRFTKKLKGNRYLWKDMKYVREIEFTHVEQMKLGAMISL